MRIRTRPKPCVNTRPMQHHRCGMRQRRLRRHQPLAKFKGGASFNNMLNDCRVAHQVAVDFAKHAESMGALAQPSIHLSLEAALDRAKSDRIAPSVIVIKTDGFTWTPGDAWWDVGVPRCPPGKCAHCRCRTCRRPQENNGLAFERWTESVKIRFAVAPIAWSNSDLPQLRWRNFVGDVSCAEPRSRLQRHRNRDQIPDGGSCPRTFLERFHLALVSGSSTPANC